MSEGDRILIKTISRLEERCLRLNEDADGSDATNDKEFPSTRYFGETKFSHYHTTQHNTSITLTYSLLNQIAFQGK